jgi:hypothetical protein
MGRPFWTLVWVSVLAGGLLPARMAEAYCRLTTDVPKPGDRCEMRGIGLSWDRGCISYSLVERDPGADGEQDFELPLRSKRSKTFSMSNFA